MISGCVTLYMGHQIVMGSADLQVNFPASVMEHICSDTNAMPVILFRDGREERTFAQIKGRARRIPLYAQCAQQRVKMTRGDRHVKGTGPVLAPAFSKFLRRGGNITQKEIMAYDAFCPTIHDKLQGRGGVGRNQSVTKRIKVILVGAWALK